MLLLFYNIVKFNDHSFGAHYSPRKALIWVPLAINLFLQYISHSVNANLLPDFLTHVYILKSSPFWDVLKYYVLRLTETVLYGDTLAMVTEVRTSIIVAIAPPCKIPITLTSPDWMV